MLTRWGYRARQFFAAFRAQVSAEEMDGARAVLGSDLYTIFAAMPRPYRRHALNVLARVREAGHKDRLLLQGALLHDNGKYDPQSRRHVTTAHRVAVVLLGALPVGQRELARLAGYKSPRGLAGWILYPFYLSSNHPQLGAELARSKGAPDALVHLIAHHADPTTTDERLRALQAADDKE